MVDREKYLYHLTITTGHARKSYRTEISDDAVRACADLVEQIRERPLMPIVMPGPLGYMISGRISGHCMTAQVFARQAREDLPLITLAIAGRERCGVAIWRELGGEDGKQPDAPWLATKIETGMINDPAAGTWLGDFERCLGWAFLVTL